MFRTESVRFGFKAAYDAKDYATIVSVAQKLPESVLQEDEKLLMYFDVASMRPGSNCMLRRGDWAIETAARPPARSSTWRTSGAPRLSRVAADTVDRVRVQSRAWCIWRRSVGSRLNELAFVTPRLGSPMRWRGMSS